MINIAIVDDDREYTELLEGYLERFRRENGHEFNVSVFSDGDEILEGYRARYDIILMDIEMRFLDGMTAAEEIRKLDPQVVIIFITNMAQYAIRGYAVDALDYVLKPLNFFAFSQRMSRAISRMKKGGPQYIVISGRQAAVKLDIAEIAYVESQGHNQVFHMCCGAQHTAACTMAEVEEKLAAYNFFRGNKGYLISLSHVDSIVDGCAVVGGVKLLLSRSRKNDFMQALTNYVGEAIK